MMSKGNIKSKHYSNCLIVSQEGNPLSTTHRERCDWYLKRQLAEEIEWPDKNYPTVIKLKFKNKGDGTKRQSDILPMTDQCVVCGCKENLSLHHVVPHRIKKFYPKHEKDHTKHLCVLLCEKHHSEIERVNETILTNPARDFERFRARFVKPIEHFFDMFRKVHMRYWIWKHGGIPKINKVFIDKFMEEKPKYLPKEWL